MIHAEAGKRAPSGPDCGSCRSLQASDRRPERAPAGIEPSCGGWGRPRSGRKRRASRWRAKASLGAPASRAAGLERDGKAA